MISNIANLFTLQWLLESPYDNLTELERGVDEEGCGAVMWEARLAMHHMLLCQWEEWTNKQHPER